MKYQLFVRDVESVPASMRNMIVLGESDDLGKIVRLENMVVVALTKCLYPQPETCEIGIRRLRRYADGREMGWQYSTCIGFDAGNADRVTVYFGDDEYEEVNVGKESV